MVEAFDSQVKDITLADWGRKEIDLAQVEMPGKDKFQLRESMILAL